MFMLEQFGAYPLFFAWLLVNMLAVILLTLRT
jgi:hypothetical protein